MRRYDLFKKSTGDKGPDYGCSLDAFGRDDQVKNGLSDDGIETDIVPRYFGNLNILRS
ncbi:MAG: hypothetical protein QNJ01_06320 [Desulfobacterales bacterium]|nr:hypothetical protein [Desulfobacterales bacterium]